MEYTKIQEFQIDRLCGVLGVVVISSRVFQMKLPLQFRSALTSRNFETTDCAKFCVRFKCTNFQGFRNNKLCEVVQRFRVLLNCLFKNFIHKWFKTTDWASLGRKLMCHYIFCNRKMSICFSSRHEFQLMLQMTFWSQF